MRSTDAMQIATQALRRDPTPTESRWMEQCREVVKHMAEEGRMTTAVRILVPPTMSPVEARTSGQRIAADFEADGYRARMRMRDDFLDEGPALVGDQLHPAGTSLIWIELDIDWER